MKIEITISSAVSLLGMRTDDKISLRLARFYVSNCKKNASLRWHCVSDWIFTISGSDENKSKSIKSRFKAARHYLKTDFKIHVSTADPCADHCSVYATSTSEPEFHGKCTHEHNISCDRCEDIKNAILDLQLSLSSPTLNFRYGIFCRTIHYHNYDHNYFPPFR